MVAEEARAPTRLAVVSGLSGSGKSVALRTLEDLDFYCVDNLPAELLPDLVHSLGSLHPRLAVGIDVRNRADNLGNLPGILADLGSRGINYELLFLDTRDEVLLKRYSETRRRHPLSADGLPLHDAIALERKLLRPLVAIADRSIDTSDLNIHQLRRLIATDVAHDESELSLLFESFAYRHGVPTDADFVFDARALPNPHWEPALRPLSGRDAAVREYLDQQPEVGRFLAQIRDMLDTWLPRIEADSRRYLTVAIGCTGGRHRSVYLAERLADHFRENRDAVMTFHRELE
ncbi:MAG TPA: RNase adapter RapZ [Xanthomonadaceae bacterium]|nr:RNase adapter RapZ [Xanthomonadaceae bacterium]